MTAQRTRQALLSCGMFLILTAIPLPSTASEDGWVHVNDLDSHAIDFGAQRSPCAKHFRGLDELNDCLFPELARQIHPPLADLSIAFPIHPPQKYYPSSTFLEVGDRPLVMNSRRASTFNPPLATVVSGVPSAFTPMLPDGDGGWPRNPLAKGDYPLTIKKQDKYFYEILERMSRTGTTVSGERIGGAFYNTNNILNNTEHVVLRSGMKITSGDIRTLFSTISCSKGTGFIQYISITLRPYYNGFSAIEGTPNSVKNPLDPSIYSQQCVTFVSVIGAVGPGAAIEFVRDMLTAHTTSMARDADDRYDNYLPVTMRGMPGKVSIAVVNTASDKQFHVLVVSPSLLEALGLSDSTFIGRLPDEQEPLKGGIRGGYVLHVRTKSEDGGRDTILAPTYLASLVSLIQGAKK